MILSVKIRRFIFRFRFAILFFSMAAVVTVFAATTERYKTAEAVAVISSRCVLTPVIDAGHGGEDGGSDGFDVHGGLLRKGYWWFLDG